MLTGIRIGACGIRIGQCRSAKPQRRHRAGHTRKRRLTQPSEHRVAHEQAVVEHGRLRAGVDLARERVEGLPSAGGGLAQERHVGAASGSAGVDRVRHRGLIGGGGHARTLNAVARQRHEHVVRIVAQRCLDKGHIAGGHVRERAGNTAIRGHDRVGATQGRVVADDDGGDDSAAGQGRCATDLDQVGAVRIHLCLIGGPGSDGEAAHDLNRAD